MNQLESTRQRAERLASFEFMLSMLAIGLIMALAYNGFAAHFCIGECSDPSAVEIWTYRLLAAALGVVLCTAIGLAVQRRARLTPWWHGLVGLIGLAAVFVFAVPSADVDTPEPAPVDRSPGTYVPHCHSGANEHGNDPDCMSGGG